MSAAERILDIDCEAVGPNGEVCTRAFGHDGQHTDGRMGRGTFWGTVAAPAVAPFHTTPMPPVTAPVMQPGRPGFAGPVAEPAPRVIAQQLAPMRGAASVDRQAVAQRVTSATPVSPYARPNAWRQANERGTWSVVADGDCVGAVLLWSPLEGRHTTVAKLADAWRKAELPEGWLLNGASAVAALGKAVAKVGNREGRIARSGDRGAWHVEAPIVGAKVGDASRTLALRVSLVTNGLHFEPADHPLVLAIHGEYDAIRAGRISTTEIRDWVAGVVYGRLFGTSFGSHRGAFFVPAAARKTMERIQAAIAESLDGFEPLTALPVAPVAQVKARLIESLSDDARQVIAEVRAKRNELRATGEDLGVQAARSALDKISAAGERLRGYEGILGPQVELRAELEQFKRDIYQLAVDKRGRAYHGTEPERFAGIWDELAKEESRGGA